MNIRFLNNPCKFLLSLAGNPPRPETQPGLSGAAMLLQNKKLSKMKTVKQLIENPKPKYTVHQLIIRAVSFIMGLFIIVAGVAGMVFQVLIYPETWGVQSYLLMAAYPVAIYAGLKLIKNS